MCDPLPSSLPPVNEVALDHAKRDLLRILAGAERGDDVSKRLVIEAANAGSLRARLNRLADVALRHAPSLDEIKADAELNPDACELRYAADDAATALSQAAGAAVVVAWPEKNAPNLERGAS